MKTKFLLFAIAAVLFLTAASVWEGAATGVSSGDLPGGGFCVATNSFPQNSIIDITNLENGKTVRVIVVSGLENSGLLATLSRSAADAIGIRGNSVRIRMSQPSDAIAFSRFREQRGILPPTETIVDIAVADTAVAETVLTEVALTAEPSFSEPEQAVSTGAVFSRLPEDKEDTTEDATMEITLVPSEERIPKVEEYVLPSEYFIDSLDLDPLEKLTVIPGIHSDTPPEKSAVPAQSSPFRVPLVKSLEQGKWYVQIGAYNRPDHVENEIDHIGTAYPIAVQNIGTDTAPIFRLLLGPLNQGESGAVLQRFKSIGYKDAFVRRN